MGSSNSHEERLTVPLYAQPPFLATDNGSIVQKFTSLCLQTKSFSSTLRLVDAESGAHVFDFKYSGWGTRRMLKTPDDRCLMSYKGKSFSSGYRVYTGEDKENPTFEIANKKMIYAEFYDRLSGELCRVILSGRTYDRVVIFYMQRGRASLGPLPKRDELENGQFQAIGRIRSPFGKAFSAPEHFIEAAPGVDITLLLTMALIRHDIERRRNSNDSSTDPASGHSIAISTVP